MAKQNNDMKANVAEAVANPQTAKDYIESGWSHYSKKEFYRAESDFQKALDLEPGNADTEYALGMTLMASSRQQDAVQAFQKVLSMLQNNPTEDLARASMLSRLAQGHINRIQTGDWGINQ